MEPLNKNVINIKEDNKMKGLPFRRRVKNWGNNLLSVGIYRCNIYQKSYKFFLEI
jgi:hypothetical protein